MKILYIHQYFRTPDEGGCTRSYHLAKGLVDSGHEVEMITAHHGSKTIKNIDGISVRYLPIAYANHYGFMRRVYAFLRFAFLAIKESKQIKKIDLAYVMTTPLTTGLVALHLKKHRNIPFYFEVGDLWPEAPVKIGAIKNRWLKSILYKFEKRCYFEAKRVVALSPAIRNYIEAASPLTKVYVLPNLAHCSFFEPKKYIRHYSSINPLKIGYIGAFGKANSLEYLINVAQKCLEKSVPVSFHFMGEGAEAQKLKRLSKHLPNVRFHAFGSSKEVKTLLEDMDAVYISFKNIRVLNTGSPNKFFDGLAAGKLIIINFRGWIKDVIEKNECGFYHTPLRPEMFIEKIEQYISDPAKLIVAQKQSRKIAEQFYDKDLMVQKLNQIIDNEKHINLREKNIQMLTA